MASNPVPNPSANPLDHENADRDLPAPPMSRQVVSPPVFFEASTPAESVLGSDYSDQLFNEFFNSAAADFDLFGPSHTLSAATAHTNVTKPYPGFPEYPISPDQTPSLNAPSPDNHSGGAGFKFASRDLYPVGGFDGLVSPEQLTKSAPHPHTSTSGNDVSAQLTPDTTGSGGSLSPDTITTTTAPPAPPMSSNPHVTISLWGKDSAYHEDSYLSTSEMQTERASSADGRRGGIDPASRSSAEFATSANQDAEARKVEKQNMAVSTWLSTADASEAEPAGAVDVEPGFEGVSNREIELGDTENVAQPGRTYFTGRGGAITETDYELMLKSTTAWDDSPRVQRIANMADGQQTRHQPESSQAAIERFERMYHDNASMVSRAATWGTRRRSLPSIADIEGVTSGNFLKKLSISRDANLQSNSRRPSILGNLRTLVRMPSTSQQNKRARAVLDDDASSYFDGDSGAHAADDQRRDSTKGTKSPKSPPRTNSWGKTKQPMPSINTALVSMGSNMASIGATHTRSGSVSQPPPPLTSPKSPLLKVSSSLRRPRSKSDAKGSPDNANANANANAHPNLVRMLKKTGGPPVASLAMTSPFLSSPSSGPSRPAIQIPATHVAVVDPDDEDEDDDEAYEAHEDGDLQGESDELIDKISPDLAGFKELVLGLNPMLATVNTYLVERIAHQQIVRYKGLLNSKIKHVGHVQDHACSNGTMCMSQGGRAIVDNVHNVDDAADVDDICSPLDGAINSDSFPQYIPMPPTNRLPAEFECPLCFQAKWVKKPSDWTKHVHEDVQPFTCTWDRCRDPKMFKRKADWVRHENEGHRHLEWWTCDVDECRHTCYRRDNFLQHLVREHKFAEPKHKTKAAIKRAGALDPTWQRVAQCRSETAQQPQDEACRFCGKTFATWKKLTVHLAKHMEHISLPLVRLVERRHVEPDTLISPAPEAPRRTSGAFAYMSTFQLGEDVPLNQQNHQHQQQQSQNIGYGQPAHPSFMYSVPVTQVQYQQAYYAQQFGVAGAMQNMQNHMPHMQSLDAAAYAGPLPVTGGYLGTHMGDASGLDAAPYAPYATTNANALGLQTPVVASQMRFDVHGHPLLGNGEQLAPLAPLAPQGAMPMAHGSGSYGHSPQQFYR